MERRQKRFTRTVENFECEHCGMFVRGDGYTNHCPSCLWSKHVDINPGDRASACMALMQPVGVASERGAYVLTHKCAACGHTKRNKLHAADDFDAAIALSRA